MANSNETLPSPLFNRLEAEQYARLLAPSSEFTYFGAYAALRLLDPAIELRSKSREFFDSPSAPKAAKVPFSIGYALGLDFLQSCLNS